MPLLPACNPQVLDLVLVYVQFAAAGNWHGVEVSAEHLPYLVGLMAFLEGAGKLKLLRRVGRGTLPRAHHLYRRLGDFGRRKLVWWPHDCCIPGWRDTCDALAYRR